ncbi:pullulanase-type alpha-1,6-glucosidase [Endozoicomonas sp. ALB091]|uniref:pullulanase-type alpha-1,6-glucosidase n=1 Tax=Endozoicomonas sp. ALB091 TaxID=3403073 RepID=UPI003BB6A6D5
MNIATKLLFPALVLTNHLHAAGLVEIIATQALPEQLLKGEEATVTWLVRSLSKTTLPDFQVTPAGVKITASTCTDQLSASEICQVSGRFQANETGDVLVKLEASAAKQAYRFTSAVASVHVFEETPGKPADQEVILYYQRPDGIYHGWGLHLFNNDNCKAFGKTDTDWNQPWMPESITQTYGALYRIPLSDTFSKVQDGCLNFIVHKGDEKDLGGDMAWHFSDTDSQLAYTYSGYNLISSTPLDGPPLIVDGAKAHWVSSATLLWNEGGGSDVDRAELLYSDDASIILKEGNISGKYQTISLAKGGNNNSVREKLPHLMNRSPLTVSADLAVIKKALKGQLLAVAYKGNQPKYATKVQVQGLLDELYKYNGELGAIVGDSGIDFKLWAPTARNVRLVTTSASKTSANKATDRKFHDMIESAAGVWSYRADNKGYDQSFYRYEVTVFHPQTDKIETYEVTDPYSLSLSTNSQYSQVVDLNAASLKPQGWDSIPYSQQAPEDMVLYETHIRDYSINTSGLANPGKFKAFTEAKANTHLQQLQAAGLTHIHLLPAFDIATVDEVPANRIDISQTMEQLCARKEVQADTDYFRTFCGNLQSGQTIQAYLQSLDSETDRAQYLYQHIRPVDSFNWGYDPLHYTVPEGSYATDPDGITRIIEFREMVKALKAANLGVVMDVVYNHTHAHGVGNHSVLDRIVPWYYQRLNPDSGIVENSTCCSNTASEFHMMEKLMIDSLKVWVKDYKVDAFRFDLMGHHLKRNIEKALVAVKAINPGIYFYGEGWEFGEVAGNARGINANQFNMAGTGVGTFTDRMRDRIRGGSPFDQGDALRQTQGYASGLHYHPNEKTAEAKAALCAHTDIIRLGMAANLKNFRFVDCHGTLRYGFDFDYNGAPAGYSLDPQEVINYVSKHDNQTLWDILMYKLPEGMPTANRVKLHNLALGITLLSQGVPFIHAGSERLRSKSMERDSYDSGDWYNRMPDDDNNYWNQGLPRADKDGANWALIKKIISDSTTRPNKENIAAADACFQKMLRIRKSSPLFRLKTEQDVIDRITYLNTGPDQIPGLIVQRISDKAPFQSIDDQYEVIIVAVNPSGDEMAFDLPESESGTYSLHPFLLQDIPEGYHRSSNSQLRIPPLSIVVFVQKET